MRTTPIASERRGTEHSRTDSRFRFREINLIFAFDQDQGLSEHTEPFDALVYVMDGEVELTLSGKPHRREFAP